MSKWKFRRRWWSIAQNSTAPAIKSRQPPPENCRSADIRGLKPWRPSELNIIHLICAGASLFFTVRRGPGPGIPRGKGSLQPDVPLRVAQSFHTPQVRLEKLHRLEYGRDRKHDRVVAP